MIRRWLGNSSQHSVVSGQWSVVSGQWSVVRFSFLLKRLLFHLVALLPEASCPHDRVTLSLDASENRVLGGMAVPENHGHFAAIFVAGVCHCDCADGVSATFPVAAGGDAQPA